jgi:hypothetical protein
MDAMTHQKVDENAVELNMYSCNTFWPKYKVM